MQPGISTHILLQQPLDPTILDAFAKAGARHIEIFASRHHFDYTDRSVVREIANWFRANDVRATLHQPTDADARWSRHTAPTLNLIAHDKGRRIEAMDEV
jgi:sugar phosphate isomerase/epimerase